MNSLEIGIVGGTRGMGKWFAKLLESKGHRVHVWGRFNRKHMKAIAPSCDVIIVGVPLSVTREVIREVGPLVRKEGAMMDLSSLKTWPVAEMLSSTSAEVVGLHPLFGPRVRSLRGKTIVICEGRGNRWKAWIEGLLRSNGLHIAELSPEAHDRAMAIVQVLTHLSTMTLGLAMQGWNIPREDLLHLATPVFKKKLTMVRRVFGENPELYSSIVALNPHSREALERYSQALEAIKDHVLTADAPGLRKLLKGADLHAWGITPALP